LEGLTAAFFGERRGRNLLSIAPGRPAVSAKPPSACSMSSRPACGEENAVEGKIEIAF
jgi:hypothetical protein